MNKTRPSLRKYFSSSSFTSSSFINSSRRNLSQLSVHTTENNVKPTGECILFPTYATRDPKDSHAWVIRTKGWALSMKKTGTKQRVLKGITKHIAGKSSANQISNRMFESRFKYFLAKGKRNKQFFIEAIGSATNLEWEDENYANLSVDDDSSTTTPAAILDAKFLNDPYVYDDDEDEDEEDSEDAKSLSTPSSPVSINADSMGVALRSERTGIFSGQFSIPDQQIKEWKSESDSIRTIKIKSEANDTTFPTSHGIVHLIEPTGVSVISDIDDTIKNTKVLAGARTVLTNTFFNPTQSIPGMAEAYSQWYHLGASFHYVSNSPFQLIHVLFSFMRNHHFPPGSLHLRPNTGILSKIRASKRSKRDSICSIIRDFPQRKFILVGDSGEIDLEIYTRIATEFPGQILKIFIRDVTTGLKPMQKPKNRRPGYIRTSSFPSFFTGNSTSQDRLDTHMTLGMKTKDTSDDEVQVSNEGLDEAAKKFAEMVLEPSLTGHGPTIDSDDLPEFLAGAHVSERLMQLHARLALARDHLKDIEIVLFKDAKELRDDQLIQQAMNEA